MKTIQEVKNAKKKLEEDISSLISQFEKENEVSVSSMGMETVGFCDLYKVGLLSGKKYNWRELRGFMLACTSLKSKFYFKDSFISQADLDRANLPQSCVGRDYDMFKM